MITSVFIMKTDHGGLKKSLDYKISKLTQKQCGIFWENNGQAICNINNYYHTVNTSKTGKTAQIQLVKI